MAEKESDRPTRSSAVDSGDGKLEIKNSHALIQVEGMLTELHEKLNPEQLQSIRNWCSTETRLNREANGGYTIAWRKLAAIIGTDDALSTQVLDRCDAFREYIEKVESGEIIPTPTPPPSIVVSRQVGAVREGVRGIYGKRPGQPMRAPSTAKMKTVR